MDVFGLSVAVGGDFLRAAAIDAGHQLGIFTRLAAGPATLDELADAAGVGAGRRRMRALCDVLAAIGAIERPAPGIARFAPAAAPPRRPVVVKAGWGLLADVIRADRALEVEGGEVERRYHHHLARAGADAARELSPMLGSGSLLDLGCSLGTYSAAFLDATPGATATLCDFGDVLELARVEMARHGDRVRYVSGDARAAPVGVGHDTVLLANLLHLHDERIAAGLCAAAARAVADDGVVVIKDLRVDEDRSGPLEGLLFALNMAVYTGGGDVYPVSLIRAWLAAAGLTYVEERRLAAAPDAFVLLARRGSTAAVPA